jgi:hypothetical protein
MREEQDRVVVTRPNPVITSQTGEAGDTHLLSHPVCDCYRPEKCPAAAAGA